MDFRELRRKHARPDPIGPEEIFRRKPKPPGIDDLYSSQAEVLRHWFNHRTKRDTVIKLHTGGGKTLVGLLIGQSVINEIHGPILYLVPNLQLVDQVLAKAHDYSIPAVQYERGEALPDVFLPPLRKHLIFRDYVRIIRMKVEDGTSRRVRARP